MEKSLYQQIREELHNVINKPSEEYIQKVANAIINKDYKTLLETTTTQLQKTPADLNAYKQTFQAVKLTLDQYTKEEKKKEKEKILEKANQYIQMGKILLPENKIYFLEKEKELKKPIQLTTKILEIKRGYPKNYRNMQFHLNKLSPQYSDEHINGDKFKIYFKIDELEITTTVGKNFTIKNTNEKLLFNETNTNWKKMYLSIIDINFNRTNHDDLDLHFSAQPGEQYDTTITSAKLELRFEEK